MTTSRLAAALLVLGASVAVCPVRAETPTAFDVALSAAKANVETPEGQKYDLEFGKQFGEAYVNTLARCASGVTDFTKFDLLLRVAASGEVEEVLTRPSSTIATCLAAEAGKGKFVKPPRASYWVRIEMGFTE